MYYRKITNINQLHDKFHSIVRASVDCETPLVYSISQYPTPESFQYLIFGAFLSLSEKNPIITRIMNEEPIGDLYLIDKVEILTMMYCSHYTTNERSQNIKRINKALEMSKKLRIENTILYARLICKYVYFNKLEGLHPRKRDELVKTYYNIIIRNYPNLFTMNTKEINIADFFDIILMLALKANNNFTNFKTFKKTYQLDQKNKKDDLFLQKKCQGTLERTKRFYERILEEEESNNRRRKVYENLLSITMTLHHFHLTIGNNDLSMRYLKEYEEHDKLFMNLVRESRIRNNEPPNTPSLDHIQKISGLEIQNEILSALIKQKKYKEGLKLAEEILGERESVIAMELDLDLKIQFECHVSLLYHVHGFIFKAFSSFSRCLELCIQEFGWNSERTTGVAIRRVLYLINAGMFRTALKDLERIKKANKDISKIKHFVEYYNLVQLGILIGYEKFLRIVPNCSKFEGLRELLLAKSERKYQNFRRCSNSQCSNTESKDKTFKRCGACGSRFYCSLKCQKEHWVLSHRKECKKIRKK